MNQNRFALAHGLHQTARSRLHSGQERRVVQGHQVGLQVLVRLLGVRDAAGHEHAADDLGEAAIAGQAADVRGLGRADFPLAAGLCGGWHPSILPNKGSWPATQTVNSNPGAQEAAATPCLGVGSQWKMGA